MPYRRGTFVLDATEVPYEGYTDGTTWNGWACPVFELEAARRIAADFLELGAGFPEEGQYRAAYDEASDRFTLYDPVNDDEATYGPDTIDVDGQSITIYPIGTREWTWEEDD
ncbi:MAG TPA: hypothetical protein VGB53_09400 [Rubricoccaceae bacterium]|jgi:hypothetical protein